MTQRHARFLTTSWDLVAALHLPDGAEASAALERLSQVYWPPIYAYLRRRGYDRHTAADLAQAYFADVVLSRKLLHRAKRAATPLRSLIIASLKRFLTDQHRRDQSRGVAEGHVQSRGQLVGKQCRADHRQPEDVFHRRWATSVLEEAIKRCEYHFTSIGRKGHWGLLNERVILPVLHGVEPPDLSGLSVEYGFVSPGHAAAALQVAKKRVIALVREIAGETTSGSASREQEFRDLLEVLQSSPC